MTSQYEISIFSCAKSALKASETENPCGALYPNFPIFFLSSRYISVARFLSRAPADCMPLKISASKYIKTLLQFLGIETLLFHRFIEVSDINFRGMSSLYFFSSFFNSSMELINDSFSDTKVIPTASSPLANFSPSQI